MTWKDLLLHPNTRVTAVEENSFLEQELEKAMRQIKLTEKFEIMQVLPVAIIVEILEKEKGECSEVVFPLDLCDIENEFYEHLAGITLNSEKRPAVRARIIFPHSYEECIELVCKSELVN